MSFEVKDLVKVASPAVEPDPRHGAKGVIVGQLKSCYAVKLDDGKNLHWFGEDELESVDNNGRKAP